MSLVAVAPHRHSYGVECDLDDWRFAMGDPRNARERKEGKCGVPALHVPTALDRALSDEYHSSDAHLLTAIMRDPRGQVVDHQPRVNKTGLSFVRSLGYTLSVEVMFADVDNPEHTPWTPELLELAKVQDRQLATAGVYYTAHGRRLVQPLDRPVEIDETDSVEFVIAAWLSEMRGLGFAVDASCQDWTRYYRLPHVRRPGARFARSPHVDLARMRPIPPPSPATRRLERGGRVRSLGSKMLARAVGDAATSPLGRAFSTAGLLGRSLGPGKVAARCPWESSHTTGKPFDSSTLIFADSPTMPLGWFHCSHGHCQGRSQAEAIAALPSEARAMLPRPGERTQKEPTRETLVPFEARNRLEQAFRHAPDGLSVVVAGCGTGKTQAAIAVASERAEVEYASKNATGKRAPAHSKTVLSVPTTKLSVEVAARARATGKRVLRVFGPLSMRREDGSPECQIHENATAFARGGLSVPWELCEGRGRAPCEYAETCRARSGLDGDRDARIVVGPHSLLSVLDEAAGSTGLLVIDEPPPLLGHEVLTRDELVTARVHLGKYFEHRYAAALGVSLDALATWIETGPLDEPGELARGVAVVDARLLEEATEQTGAESAVEAAKRALEDPKRKSPPVQASYAASARRAKYIAQDIGATSRVARIVWTALTGAPGATIARIEERKGSRVLVVTMPDVQLREALRREGQVVVADAGGRQHLDIYRLVVGYAPPVTEAHVGDGAAIARTWIRRRASRSAWMVRGRLRVDGSLVRAVDLLVRWAEEVRPAKLAIVTFVPLRLALEHALGRDVTEEWRRRDQDPRVLTEVREKLGPLVRRLPGEVDLGHYGGVRGLDHWREHDALATLGDPYGQLTDARWESELLKLSAWEGRLEAAARGELEQAHGRLRTVHRATPAAALHVGDLCPGGWEPSSVTMREDRGGGAVRGNHRTGAPVDIGARIAAIGVRGAAREIGVDERTVRRWASSA